MDLALNDLQRLICHKTQPTNQPISQVGTEGYFTETMYQNEKQNKIKRHGNLYKINLFCCIQLTKYYKHINKVQKIYG